MPKTKSSSKTKASAKATASEAKAPASSSTSRASSSSKKGFATFMGYRFRNDLTLAAIFAELLASFGLVSVLLSVNANAIVAGITMLVFIMMFSRISGGHVSPTVTVALYATRKISTVRAFGYIVAQLLGAMLALVVITQFVHAAPATLDQYTGQPAQAQVFSIQTLAGTWSPFFAEALGGIVLGLGVAAAFATKRQDLETGFLIGSTLILGLLIATQGGGTALLNPAAALGLNAYKMNNFWTISVYAIAPLLGAAVGAWAYKILQWDEIEEEKEINA